jgi:hypothetical protein
MKGPIWETISKTSGCFTRKRKYDAAGAAGCAGSSRWPVCRFARLAEQEGHVRTGHDKVKDMVKTGNERAPAAAGVITRSYNGLTGKPDNRPT